MPAGHQKGWRGSCLGLSCFRGSPIPCSDAGHPVEQGRRAPSFTWWRLRKKQKTVPVDASTVDVRPRKTTHSDDPFPQAAGEEAASGKVEHDAKEKEPWKKHQLRTAPPQAMAAAAVATPGQSFFWRLRTGSKDGTRSKVQLSGSRKDEVGASNSERQRLRNQPEKRPRLPSISPKYDSRCAVRPTFPPKPARTVPSPLCAPRPAPPVTSPAASPAPAKPQPNQDARTTTRLGGARAHKKSEEPSPTLCAGKNDQVLGLSVMAVVLVMMVLFGRVGAVLLTCLWFYCLPRRRATIMDNNGEGGRSTNGINFDWEEYKRKVVLEGLLQRNGRRMPGLL